MLRIENARTCEHRATTSLKATRQASGGIDRNSSSGRRTSVEAESASAVARALVVRRATAGATGTRAEAATDGAGRSASL